MLLRTDRAVRPPGGGAVAWEEVKQDYARVVLDRWRPYLASGLEPEAIVGRYISSPIDIERVMPSMKHRDRDHGEMSQDQLGVFSRPFHEYPPFRIRLLGTRLFLWGFHASRRVESAGRCGHVGDRGSPKISRIQPWWQS